MEGLVVFIVLIQIGVVIFFMAMTWRQVVAFEKMAGLIEKIAEKFGDK